MTKKKIPSVQDLYDLCKLTFSPSAPFPPPSQAIKSLSFLMDSFGPADVGLIDAGEEDDRGHGTFGVQLFNRVDRWAQPITYVDVHEGDNFTAALLTAEVSFRANNFRKQYHKDSKVFNATSAELEGKIADLSIILEKEMANSKRREEDMRSGFETERLLLRNELRVAEVRLEAAVEEARKAKEEQNSAQVDAELARAELKIGEETFKEVFLKSEEFGEIIGDKALSFLNVGFDGCVEQFKSVGYPPEGTSASFLDVNKVLDSLPEEM